MKVTIEVDCTPEEARRAIGLPDLTPLHDHFLAQVRENLDKVSVGPEAIANMMRGWTSAGEQGAEFWRKMFAAGGERPTKG